MGQTHLQDFQVSPRAPGRSPGDHPAGDLGLQKVWKSIQESSGRLQKASGSSRKTQDASGNQSLSLSLFIFPTHVSGVKLPIARPLRPVCYDSSVLMVNFQEGVVGYQRGGVDLGGGTFLG